MKYQLFFFVVISTGLPTLSAEEFAVVTADNGYLLNGGDEVVGTAPFYGLFRIKKEDGSKLIVEFEGNDVRLSEKYVHRSSQFGYVNADNEDSIFETFQLIERAARASDAGEYDEATKLTNKALTHLESKTNELLPLQPWILQYEAFLHFAEGNLAEANRVLDRCNKLVTELDEQRHLQMADILNTRGLVLWGEDQPADAITLFEQALQILMRELGPRHHDCAAVNENLGLAFAADGNLEQAIRRQRFAVSIKRKIMPKEAVEVPAVYFRLGDLLQQDESYELAMESLEKALSLYTEHHPEQSVDIAACQQKLGDIHLKLGRTGHAIAAWDEAVRVLTEAEGEDSEQVRATWKLIETVVSDEGLRLVDAGRPDEAADLILDLLTKNSKPSREYHMTLIATLAKAYVLQGKVQDGRKLLQTVMVLAKTEKNGASVDSVAGQIAFTELGRLDVFEKNWEDAVAKLDRATVIYERLKTADTLAAADVHELLATAHRELKAVDSAKTHFARALAIYEKRGQADSELARSVAAQLREMQPAVTQPSKLAAFNLFDLVEFLPKTEQMVVTAGERQILGANADNFDTVIASIKADTNLWSLELRDGRHRIFVEDSQQFGWIAAADVTPQHELLCAKSLAKINERLKNDQDRDRRIEEIRIAYQEAHGDDLLTPKVHASRHFDNADEGIAAILKALKLIKFRDDTDYLSAWLYTDLAALYDRSKQPEKAAEAADEAFWMLGSSMGFRHPMEAMGRQRRALNAVTTGDDYDEHSEIQELLRTAVTRFGPNDPRVQAHRLAWAASKVRIGNFSDAATIYTEVIASAKQESKRASLPVAVAYLATGRLLAQEGRNLQATTFLERAAEDLAALGNPFPVLRAESLLHLAGVHSEQGDHDKALTLLDEADEVQLSPSTAAFKFAVLIQKSRILNRLEQTQSAVGFAAAALGMARVNFRNSPFLQHDARHAAGRAHAGQSQSQAVVEFEAARKLVFDYINETVAYQSFRHQLSFLTANKRSLDEALSMALLEGSDSLAETTATWLINSHNLLPEIAAEESRLIALCTEQSELNILTEWRPLRKDRAAVPLMSSSENARRKLDSFKQDLQREEAGVFKKLPDSLQARIERDQPWLTCSDVRKKLKSDEVLIVIRKLAPNTEFPWELAGSAESSEFREGRYAVWLIPATGTAAVKAFLLGSEGLIDELGVDQAMRATQDIVEQIPRIGERQASEYQDIAFQKLADRLWTPIAKQLPSTTKRITFCLDGDLHRVPWIALPTVEGRLMFDDFSLRYLSSPRDLFHESITIETSAPIILSASTSVDQDASVAQAFPDRVQFLGRRLYVSQPVYIREKLAEAIGANRLPTITETEVEDIARSLGAYSNASVRPYTGQAASEFRYQATLRPQTLHFAVNSVVLPRDDVPLRDPFSPSQSRTLVPPSNVPRFHPFERCGILLAGYSQTKGQPTIFDGILTGEEILTQDLRATELVVLTHCPVTLEGDPSDVSVELLPEIFHAAGAQSVISPLWEVDETTLSALMKTFYQQLAAGRSKSESLRSAQREIRDEHTKKYGAAHPFYWAGFRLIGAE